MDSPGTSLLSELCTGVWFPCLTHCLHITHYYSCWVWFLCFQNHLFLCCWCSLPRAGNSAMQAVSHALLWPLFPLFPGLLLHWSPLCFWNIPGTSSSGLWLLCSLLPNIHFPRASLFPALCPNVTSPERLFPTKIDPSHALIHIKSMYYWLICLFSVVPSPNFFHEKMNFCCFPRA
jgi:hypothetical protein